MLPILPAALLLIPGCSRPNVLAEPPGDSSPTTTDSEQPRDTDNETPTGDTAIEQVGDLTFDQVPVLIIDTLGQSILDDAKIEAWLEAVRDHDGTLGDLDTAARSFEGPIGIELHGTSSAGYEKTGYRFETRDSVDGDLDFPLLGLPSESDWVLHGPYSDKTFVRNALAYALGRQVAADRGGYEPRTAFLELILNDDYRGIYVMVERVKRSEDRLNLDVPAHTAEAGDITGGYIVKIDQGRSTGWTSALGTAIDYAYPRDEDISPEQDAYLQAYFDNFQAMLVSEGWDDPTTGYEAWIDVESFLDHWLVNELTHNIDAYRLSAYLHKKSDTAGGKLHAGPVWDFDRAWGNVNYCDSYNTHGWIIDDLGNCGCSYQFPGWWTRLLEDPAYQDRLRCRWEQLRAGVLADDALLATMDTLTDEVDHVQSRDNGRWNTIGVNISPNYYVGETWQDELDWMQSWIVARTGWMDANVPGSCAR